MSNEALLREAARCRRLARMATDPALVATLESIAREYESRTLEPHPALAPAGDAADNLVAFPRA